MDLLEPTSRIPPDVSFKIMERPNNNEGEGEEKVMGEVPFLLVGLSFAEIRRKKYFNFKICKLSLVRNRHDIEVGHRSDGY